LCKQFDAGLIVDEAHATGILGKKGEGRVAMEIPEFSTLARVHTFSKALGTYGAVILCSKELKEFLINYCRPFIFSSSLPFYSLAAVKVAYEFLDKVNERRQHLVELASNLKRQIARNGKFQLIASETPIQSILIPDNQRVKDNAGELQQKGFDVRPILYPTVAKGMERIRICLHSFNTEREVSRLAEAINAL
jgi:8-amino-7-oxononanoate synthase